MKGSKVFIPSSIEDMDFNRNRYFTSDSKIGWIALFIIMSAILSLYLGPYFKYSIIFIPTLVIYTFIAQYYIRKVVLEENKWIDIYRHNNKHKHSTVAPIWGIYDFDKDYVIKFNTLYKGVVVKLKMGSIVGRNENTQEFHFAAIENFYRNLLYKGFRFSIITTKQKPEVPPSIQYYENLLEMEKNENLRDLIRIQLNHIKRNLFSRRDELNTYYIIYTNNSFLMKDLENIRVYLDRLISNSVYNEYKILTKNDFFDLFMDLNNIKYIDFDDLVSNSKNMELKVKPFKVLKRFDEDGLELFNVDFGVIDEDLEENEKHEIKNFDKKFSNNKYNLVNSNRLPESDVDSRVSKRASSIKKKKSIRDVTSEPDNDGTDEQIKFDEENNIRKSEDLIIMDDDNTGIEETSDKDSKDDTILELKTLLESKKLKQDTNSDVKEEEEVKKDWLIVK